MSTIAEVGITTEKLYEVAETVRRVGNEAVRLRIVERFLSEVERRQLKTVPVIFDIERIRTALQILKTLSSDDEMDECSEAEFRLGQEFHLWRSLINERDHAIETYHFRRYFDAAPQMLDDEILAALGGFYRDLEFSPATQSKFDLVITRLFSRINSNGKRQVKFSRSEVVEKIERIFLASPPDQNSANDIQYAVAAIDGFTEEALHLDRFEDLVHSNLCLDRRTKISVRGSRSK